MEKSQHIIRNSALAFVFTIIPIVLFILFTSRTPIVFGIRSFDVLTGSMEPKIHTGSIIFTMPENTYQIGEIITFKRKAIIVAHRIVAIKNGQFLVKGDANKLTDSQPVNKAFVIGKVITIAPYIGKITNFIKTIPGFILLVAIPILIFIGFEVKTIKQEWEKEVEKRLLKRMKTEG